MAPLSEGYFVIDVIAEVPCEAIVVARNQLGCINHTLLTVLALRAQGVHRLKVVLMDMQKRDASAASNPAVLSELLAPTPLISLPFLPGKGDLLQTLKKNQRSLQKTLSGLLLTHRRL